MNCTEIAISIRDYLGVGGLITLLCAFIVPPLTYYFIMKAYRRQQALSAYRTFNKHFIDALNSLEKEDTTFIDIIISEFPKHDTAIRNILMDLDSRPRDRMNEKLKEYKKVYDKWGKPNGTDINAISASNIKYVLDKLKTPELENRVKFSGDPDTLDALRQLSYDDFIFKKYLHNLINEILDIAKQS